MKTKTLAVFCFGHRSLACCLLAFWPKFYPFIASIAIAVAFFFSQSLCVCVCVCIFDLHLSGSNAQKRIRSGQTTKGHSIKMRVVCRARNSLLAAKHLIQFAQLISPRKFPLNYAKALMSRSCHIDYILV